MMSQTASLFQYYQKWVFEEEKLSEHSENSQNTLIKANSSTNFILFYFFIALWTKQNSSKDVSVTHFQNMLIWNKWLLHHRLKELLHPILVWQGNWFLLPLVKLLSIYLWWNKLLIYNAKVSDNKILWKKQSCFLVHSFHFNLAELIFLKQIFI